MSEKVNHPDHYGGENNPYEAIKVIEAWDLNFHLGNVVKYISRAGKKSKSSIEDLKKAEWYLSRYVQFIQKQITDYINNVLNEKRSEFSGMAVCPFAAPELANNKLMIAMLGEDDKGIRDLLEEFAASDYDSAIIAFAASVRSRGYKAFSDLYQ